MRGLLGRLAIAATAGATFIAAAPATAQMSAEVSEGAASQAEPLTAEQAERMPLARRVIALLMPEGSASTMMDGLSGAGFVGLGMSEDSTTMSALSETLNYAYYNAELEPTKAQRALTILDPVWSERQAIEVQFTQQMLTEMWAPYEPALREAMAELYAIQFTQVQLEDIEAFFQTETGQVFANGSASMSRSPRLWSVFTQTPDFTEHFSEPDTSEMDAALAALPQIRRYNDLTTRERALLGALLGLGEDELRETMNMSDIDTMEAAADQAE